MKIFKKILLTSTLLTTTNIALADKEMDENFINIFRDKTLITNNYFDLGESDTLKITVTGTRTERSVLDLPGSVNVYDFNEIESSSSSSWRELFSDAPGLGSQDFIRSDYSRDYAKGDAGNINIRGLEGNRILTQIDGATIPRFSYGKSTFSVSRSNFIELSNLGKIEVLKGSGSSLYGSDALGGVVTLRSLNPEDILKEDQEKAVRFSTGYKSVNSSIKPNLKYAFRDGDIEGIVSLTYENLEELKRKTDAKYINQVEGDNNSIYGKIVKKIGENKKISLLLENVNKNKTNTANENNINSLAYRGSKDTSKDLTDSTSNRSVIEYNYNSKIDRGIDAFKGSLYLSKLNYQNEWRYTGASSGNANENQITDLDQETIGTNLQFTNNIPGKKFDQKLTYGFEGSLFEGDRIQKDYVVSGGTSTLDGTYRRNPKSDVTKYGIYIQDEISKGKWDLIAGLRYDNIKLDAHPSTEWFNSGSTYLTDQEGTVGQPHDIEDDNISPNLALMYRLNDNSNIYGKYSKGFRTPSWEEFNSSHINVYNRGRGWQSYSTLGNPNLKSETSDNYEIGIKSVNNKFDYSIAGFYQKFENFLEQSVQDGSTTVSTIFGPLSSTIYRTKNIADAKVYGFEAKTAYYFDERDSGLSFENAFSYQYGDNETDNEPLDTINPFSLVSNLKYLFPNEKLVINLKNTYTGVPRTSSTYSSATYAYIPEAYNITDLQLGYKFNNNFSTNLGIYNIFDTTYYKWSDLRSNGGDGTDDQYYQRYAQPGTSIQAGFNWRF